MNRDRMNLWQVREVGFLDNNTAVVENIFTKNIMLRKIMPRNNFPLMMKISELSHPNLMKVYDAMDDGHFCIVLLEYIDGYTLDTVLNSDLLYVQKNAVKWTQDICAATECLHKAGIIHRDINPNNIMVDKSGKIRLIDFNISREMKKTQTRDTRILGTAGFTSPEQFGFQETDERADVYSIGVLFNIMLTGAYPSQELAQGVYGEIVDKATQISRDDRYNSTKEMSFAIKRRIREKKPLPLKILCSIPGFRSLKVWKMLIALLFYFLYFYIFIGLIDTYNKYPNLRPQQLGMFIFTIGIPFLIFFDVFNLGRFMGNISKKSKRGFFIAMGIIAMILSFVLVSKIPSLL